MKSKDYYMDCMACSHRWITRFVTEFGFLVAETSDGEECPECGSDDIEVDKEYT